MWGTAIIVTSQSSLITCQNSQRVGLSATLSSVLACNEIGSYEWTSNKFSMSHTCRLCKLIDLSTYQAALHLKSLCLHNIHCFLQKFILFILRTSHRSLKMKSTNWSKEKEHWYSSTKQSRHWKRALHIGQSSRNQQQHHHPSKIRGWKNNNSSS